MVDTVNIVNRKAVTAAINAGRAHSRAGRLQEAEAIYRWVLAVEPNHPDAQHLLGVIARQTGKHQLAVDLISGAIAANSHAAEYYNSLGLAL